MATQTTNYGLTKPSYNETADIGVINSNMDIIDAKMKAIENKAGSGGGGGNTDTYGHVKVGSVTIDASGDDTIELVAGSNVTLIPDTTSKSVTISATGGGGTSDYLQLSNKPKINGVELVDNTTTEDLGIVVPQYTSELENDSGFITNETDPTVPAWAKEPTKPTYTAEEVGALPSNTPIPDPTSVVVDRFVSVGTHIADISVNGEKTELYAPAGGGGTSVTVDSELSTTSENPVQNKVITQALNGKGTYSKPTGGIPKTDLASEVQTSLGKADTALQEHQDISGKADKTDVTALSNTISDAWNASTTYAVGQYCIYNNSLWKCLVQHSGQTPTEGTYWTKVTVANELTSVNNSLNYSAEETVIGTWNGKTHYRKVYFLDIDVKTNAGEVNFDTNFQYGDKITKIDWIYGYENERYHTRSEWVMSVYYNKGLVAKIDKPKEPTDAIVFKLKHVVVEYTKD